MLFGYDAHSPEELEEGWNYRKTEVKRIEASCPKCHADPEKIIYQNSGPIVRVYCSECGFKINDYEAWDHHFKSVIDYWNHVGIYMPQD